jgi:hypothetical protein
MSAGFLNLDSKRRAQAQGWPREAEACRDSRTFCHGDAAPEALDGQHADQKAPLRAAEKGLPNEIS